MKTLPLNTADNILISAAVAAIRANYSHPRHTVGAAVRCASGQVYTGVNIETCGYGPCAEPVALGAAVTAGERAFDIVVAIAGGGDDIEVLQPCGNCRQLLADYAPDAMVILPVQGHVVKVRAAELLPEPYPNFD